MNFLLDPGYNRVVSNTDVFVNCNGVGFLAELRVVVVVIQNVYVDSSSRRKKKNLGKVFTKIINKNPDS